MNPQRVATQAIQGGIWSSSVNTGIKILAESTCNMSKSMVQKLCNYDIYHYIYIIIYIIKYTMVYSLIYMKVYSMVFSMVYSTLFVYS